MKPDKETQNAVTSDFGIRQWNHHICLAALAKMENLEIHFAVNHLSLKNYKAVKAYRAKIKPARTTSISHLNGVQEEIQIIGK